MTVLSKIFNPQSKVLYHLDTVLDYFDGKNVDPITMEIDPSNACNHSCPFCISGHIHLSKFKGTEFFNRQMMDKKTLLNLVQDLSKTKIKSIAFTGGGEPTMNPSLKDAIVYVYTKTIYDINENIRATFVMTKYENSLFKILHILIQNYNNIILFLTRIEIFSEKELSDKKDVLLNIHLLFNEHILKYYNNIHSTTVETNIKKIDKCINSLYSINTQDISIEDILCIINNNLN